jgi:hypothetical protein
MGDKNARIGGGLKNQVPEPKYTSLNPFDIRNEILHVQKFALMILKKFLNMIRKIGDYIKKFIFSAFKQSPIVFAIFLILLAGVLLFSKNRISNVLMIVYSLSGFIIFLVALCVLRLFFAFFKELWNLILLCYSFFKKKNESTLKGFVKVIIFILRVLIVLFFLSFIVTILVILAQILSFLIRFNNSLFKTLNDMFSAIQPIDSIGSTIRKIFENC